MNRKELFLIAVSIFVGIVIGGLLFSKTQPRSFLTLQKCEKTCLNTNELFGLLASVGIEKFPDFIPDVVLETDKTIVVKHPFPQAKVHYLVLPKKDIKDIGDIGIEENEYLVDAMRVISELVRRDGLTNYQIISNGPAVQKIRYLHFHVVGE